MKESPLQFRARQQSLFLSPEQPDMQVSVTDEVASMIAANCVAAFSISGGKDGTAAAIAGVQYLDAVGHKGPRVLIHADLGRVEWKDSLPACERLAKKLGMELIVVRRAAGDMMDRWLGRWRNNVARYQALECVRLILPWSTPSLRFCTSELKSKPIESELKKRFPFSEILTITGIRRQESAKRRLMPVSKPTPALTRNGLRGVTWNDVIEWPIEQVFSTAENIGLEAHEAYTKYGVSRVSCVFCIMSSIADLYASVTCPENHSIYIEMVELEAASTFSFQEQVWLADIAPHLLSSELRERVALAKVAARRREIAEARLPAHLLFKENWPECMPSFEEAALIAQVRIEVADAVGIHMEPLTPHQVIARYEQLIEMKAEKDVAKALKEAKVAGRRASKAAKPGGLAHTVFAVPENESAR